MFLALREMRFAKGRFTLIAGVIAMMTFLVVMLSALTAGLSDQSISAVTRLPGSTLVVQAPAAGSGPSLAQSALPAAAATTLSEQPGAARLGVTTTRAAAGRHAVALTVFGADAALPPAASDGAAPHGGVMLDAATARTLGVAVGGQVRIGDLPLRVDGIGPTGSFAHTAVGYTTVDTWRALAHGQDLAAVVLAHGTAGVAGTTTLPMSKAATAVPGYGSEHGSLLAMQALLVVISALVVGSFFAVWTAQRRRQLAIARAMGASRLGYLLRDGLGQAALVLLAGEGIGALLGAAAAAVVSGAVPISLTAAGVALPALAMAVLGALGALPAIRTVAVVDPLVALSR